MIQLLLRGLGAINKWQSKIWMTRFLNWKLVMTLVFEVSGGYIWRKDYGSATRLQFDLEQRAKQLGCTILVEGMRRTLTIHIKLHSWSFFYLSSPFSILHKHANGWFFS